MDASDLLFPCRWLIKPPGISSGDAALTASRPHQTPDTPRGQALSAPRRTLPKLTGRHGHHGQNENAHGRTAGLAATTPRKFARRRVARSNLEAVVEVVAWSHCPGHFAELQNRTVQILSCRRSWRGARGFPRRRPAPGHHRTASAPATTAMTANTAAAPQGAARRQRSKLAMLASSSPRRTIRASSS